MKRFMIIAAAVLVMLVVSGPALAGVVNSKHDLSIGGPSTYASTNISATCVFCHTPHMTQNDGTEYAQQPLWNHTLATTANYGVYGSDTFDATENIADIGGATLGSAKTSNLCMSCHDGTVAPGSLYNDPNAADPDNNTAITGSANLGTNLQNDHPINFDYTDSDNDDADIAEESGVTAYLDGNGFVQCTSCHDPHEDTYGTFLRESNVDSALCTNCHLK